MMLLAVGCSYRTTPVDIRERLAFREEELARAHTELCTGFDCEAVILSTCNRVELYAGAVCDSRIEDRGSRIEKAPCGTGIPARATPAGQECPAHSPGGTGIPARATPAGQECPAHSPSSILDPRSSILDKGEGLDAEAIAAFLAEFHNLPPADLRPHLYIHRQGEAVRHLFRVAASLDSLIVGEGQIAGQVKKAYEQAVRDNSVGPLLHALFRHARQVARRVRTETGISRGHVSVSSAAVDYVKQVFDHFGDKTVLVIGAGKMGELTLRHLRQLRPQRIWVTNRSPDKAVAVARGCGGEALPWERLDDLLAGADIVLSTTGAAEPIVTRERYERIAARRCGCGTGIPARGEAARAGMPVPRGGPVVILDIAVPRDFDPRIHDGDRTCLFNIDDLKRIREATLQDRLKHVEPAEAIVNQEAKGFLRDWARRRNGPVIARLTQDFEAKRQEVVQELFGRLNGRLTDADRRQIEGAFRLLQNRLLHGPITALTEETHSGPAGHTLLDALRKLFRLQE